MYVDSLLGSTVLQKFVTKIILLYIIVQLYKLIRSNSTYQRGDAYTYKVAIHSAFI